MAATVEKKVKAATGASFAVGILIAVLNGAVADESLLGPLPAWLQAIVLGGGPGLLTFLGGWQAKHTPRLPVD
ncbi:holin [Streptomyces sp. NPDC058045]|uniref:holin n=1 Tax=Streptomyces sp. NPDC058045 TaxID=3346311 RepID=UPI0036F07B0B